MNISEIFYSIQGEGVLAGVPSVFVRTSGCNLRCTWCDTPYTSWQPDGKAMELDAVWEQVTRYSCDYTVVTGGEPMIQPQVAELCAGLRERRQHITIETAGTCYRKVECDLMSISPKLSNSTPHAVEEGRWAAQHDRLRYQPDVLRLLISEYDYQLKFVVCDREDTGEILHIVEQIGADRHKVLLMPEGTTSSTIGRNSDWVVEACKSFGYRYCPRLHVQLWGNRRGV